MSAPGRGEIWLADLSPTRGREQAGRRPVLVLSEDLFNAGPSGLVIVLPITSTVRDIPTHVRVAPPEGGLDRPSAILCDAVRSVSKERLTARRGMAAPATMAQVEDCLRILLRL